MPLHVPDSLDRLLSLLGPCFSQPVFQTFRALVAGFVARVGEHTVTGLWQAVRLAGRVHHSRAHDFFARRRWDSDRLGLVLLEFLVTVFVAAGAPIRLAIDDTLFGRSGRRVFGAHYLHDGSPPGRAGGRGGATASSWSASSSRCRALAAAARAYRCCSGCFAPATTPAPTGAPSRSWPGRWSS